MSGVHLSFRLQPVDSNKKVINF